MYTDSGVKKGFDALEEALRKLPPDRQGAFRELIDEQEQDETEDAGGADSPSDD